MREPLGGKNLAQHGRWQEVRLTCWFCLSYIRSWSVICPLHRWKIPASWWDVNSWNAYPDSSLISPLFGLSPLDYCNGLPIGFPAYLLLHTVHPACWIRMILSISYATATPLLTNLKCQDSFFFKYYFEICKSPNGIFIIFTLIFFSSFKDIKNMRILL